MFDLDALDMGKIHTEQLEANARRAAILSRSFPAPYKPIWRISEVLGNLLIETGLRLKDQARIHTETASSPTWLITL